MESPASLASSPRDTGSTTSPSSHDVYQRPGNEEINLYYYGIAGTPKLVARTSRNPWTKPEEECGWGHTTCQIPKRYATINSEEIVHEWTREVSNKIIEALEGCSWSYFFPIRIGLERDSPKPPFPIILQIAVEEGSLDWNTGLSIALECRKILREFRIFDVEVEIREGRCDNHGSCQSVDRNKEVKFEDALDEEGWTDHNINEKILPMLRYSGYAIGYHDEELRGEGTVGLHLKLEGDESTVYALTCRHVVHNRRALDESYKATENPRRQYHVQAARLGFERCFENLERFKKHINQLLEQKCANKVEKERVKLIKQEVKYIDKIHLALQQKQETGDNKIGYLAYHPKYKRSSRQLEYVKDWALVTVESNPSLHNAVNQVYIGDDGVREAKKPINREFWDEISKELLNKGFLTLQLEDTDEEDTDEEDIGEESMKIAFRVGKRGSKTGLTFGTKSAIEAVVRRPTKDQEDTLISWEMLVVSRVGDKYKFSEPGDSGSCVFDFQGRVVGILTGSSDAVMSKPNESWTGGTDISFVSPIKWVFDDIQAFTHRKPRLA